MDDSAGDAVGVGSGTGGLVSAGDAQAPVEAVAAASSGTQASAAGAPEGAADARERKQRPFWKEVPLLVVVAIVMAVVIKTFLVQAFFIPSQSMQNTLQPGDRVLVDKLSPWFGATPQRGQVVVFKDPDNWLGEADLPAPSGNAFTRDAQSVLSTIGLMPAADDNDLIKRVIAVGGDTIQCDAREPVKVNGVALSEPYIYPGSTPCDDYPVGTVKVPKGDLWVMGDHRNDSADSRYQRDNHNGTGFVPVKDVVGRAFVVAWPLNHWAFLSVPSTFHQSGLAASALPLAAPAAGSAALVLPVSLLYRRRRRNRR